jgi:DNA-binding winged helix-turn-helix (wHTH) protein
VLDVPGLENDQLITTAQLAALPDFTLGQSQISPSTRMVHGPGGTISLEPRVMQLLVVLGHSSGRVVTRDTLFRRCWGLADIGDASLNRVVACARRVAEKIALNSFQIETVPRTGYVLRESPVSSDGPVDPPAVRDDPWVGRRAVVASGAALCLAGAAGVGWRVLRPKGDPEIKRTLEQAQEAVREGMPDDMARAAALYRLVIDKDPDNAVAWAGLAGVYRFQWEFSSREEAPALQARARSAAKRALELDPDNGSAQATLAGLMPMFGNWAVAEAEMRRVYARHPREIGVRLARLLYDTGRLREALELASDAVAKDPEVPRYCGTMAASNRPSVRWTRRSGAGRGTSCCGSRGSGCWPIRNARGQRSPSFPSAAIARSASPTACSTLLRRRQRRSQAARGLRSTMPSSAISQRFHKGLPTPRTRPSFVLPSGAWTTPSRCSMPIILVAEGGWRTRGSGQRRQPTRRPTTGSAHSCLRTLRQQCAPTRGLRR